MVFSTFLPPSLAPALFCCLCCNRRTIGYVDQAIKLYGELQAMIEGHEQAMQFDYQARLAAQQEARQRLDNLVQSYPPHPDQGPDQPPPGLQQQRSEQGDSSGLQQNESSKRD